MSKFINFDVIDPAINLSDHLPPLVVYTSDMPNSHTNVDYIVNFIRHLGSNTIITIKLIVYEIINNSIAK